MCHRGEINGVFIANRLVDLIFIADMVAQFFIMYQTSRGEEETGMVWINDRCLIVRRYLKGWFAVDFLATGLSAVDIVPFLNQAGGAASMCVCMSTQYFLYMLS